MLQQKKNGKKIKIKLPNEWNEWKRRNETFRIASACTSSQWLAIHHPSDCQKINKTKILHLSKQPGKKRAASQDKWWSSQFNVRIVILWRYLPRWHLLGYQITVAKVEHIFHFTNMRLVRLKWRNTKRKKCEQNAEKKTATTTHCGMLNEKSSIYLVCCADWWDITYFHFFHPLSRSAPFCHADSFFALLKMLLISLVSIDIANHRHVLFFPSLLLPLSLCLFSLWFLSQITIA